MLFLCILDSCSIICRYILLYVNLFSAVDTLREDEKQAQRVFISVRPATPRETPPPKGS